MNNRDKYQCLTRDAIICPNPSWPNLRGYGVNQWTAVLVQQKKEPTLLGNSQLHCYSEIAEQKVPQRKKKTGRGNRGGVKSCMLIQQQYHFPWDKTGDYVIFLVSLPHNDICQGFSIAGRETYTAWMAEIVHCPAQLCVVVYYRRWTHCPYIRSAALDLHKI